MRNFRDRYRYPGGLLAARRGGGAAFTPAALNPYAWYDVHLGGSATQITDSSANARAVAANGAATAAATWLPYTTPAVYLTGVAGSCISTPDSVALSFSNDIEVVCRIKAVDWSAAANQTIAGKYLTTGNQRSWRFYASTAGAVGLSVSQDGSSTVTTVTVTPSTPLADNAWMWLRLRLDLTNGSNSVGTVDTAADTGSNDDIPTSWTANGTATSTTIAAIFDSTAAVEIGSFSNGATERFNGWIGRMIVKSGFDGTTVADFDATLCGQTGYTGSVGNVWTVGRPATGLKTVVQSPTASATRGIWLYDGSNDGATFPNAALPPAPSGTPSTFVVAGRIWGAATEGQLVSTRATTGLVPGAEIYISAAGQLSTLVLASGVLASRGPVNFTSGQRQVAATVLNATTFLLNVNGTATATTARPGADNGGTSTGFIGSLAGSLQFAAYEFEALLTFDRALSSAELAQIATYYGSGL